MRKTLGSLLFCLVLVLVFCTTASATNSSTNSNSISVKSNDQGCVVFNVTVKSDSEGYVSWIEFGDSTGISLQNGKGQVRHFYPTSDNYIVTMYMANKQVAQTKVIVTKEQQTSNKIEATVVNFNKLTISASCYQKTKLDWGDGTSVVLPKGNSQNINHDYSYNVKGYKIYTLTFGTTTATFTIDDVAKGSVFTTAETPTKVTSEIVNWTLSNSITSTYPINNWGVGNLVTLDLNTEIREDAGMNYKIIKITSNSYWLVKIIDGPKFIGAYTWWKIQLANEQTGWIRQDLANPSNLFEKTD